jgi:isopenicillin-N N-acyltransferase like protein
VSPIPVIRASGTPYQRGLAIGQALADPIRRSAAYNLAHFARRGLDRAAIEALAGPLLEATRRGLPHELAALHGMADGAGLPLLDVLVPNAYEELDPHADPGPWADRAGPIPTGPSRAVERCSALTVVGPGTTLLGHNEQWLANEPGDTVLIVELPDDPAEPAVVSPTCASWRPAVGMTSSGHAQGVMSLTARDDRPGIPRVLVSRAALGARDPVDALRLATPEERSGGYAYLHAFAGGRACAVETTAARAALAHGPAIHTNHYLDPELATLGATPSAGSLARHARLAGLVAAAPPSTSAEVMAILADHGSTPSTICLHPDPADGDDAEAVVFAMVCDLEAGRMWIAPGRPCEVAFEAFDLADLLAGDARSWPA